MKRMIVIQRICFLLFVLIISYIGESEARFRRTPTPTTERPVSKKDACNFWKQFTEEMNNISKVYSYLAYNCSYDPEKCHGADCTGAMRYQIQGMKLLNINFCFGMRINHCDSPISVDMYYINAKNTKNSFSDRIYHQDSKPLKNFKVDLGTFGKAEPYLFFNLTRPVPHHVLFGIRAKVKVTTKLFNLESWPSMYQQDIIPNTEIPVTPCPANHSRATVLEPKCIHRVSLPPTMNPININMIKSLTYNRSCDITLIKSCGPNEMCVGKESSAICKCFPYHEIDRNTGYCSGNAIASREESSRW